MRLAAARPFITYGLSSPWRAPPSTPTCSTSPGPSTPSVPCSPASTEINQAKMMEWKLRTVAILLGYCLEDRENLLIYKFMTNSEVTALAITTVLRFLKMSTRLPVWSIFLKNAVLP